MRLPAIVSQTFSSSSPSSSYLPVHEKSTRHYPIQDKTDKPSSSTTSNPSTSNTMTQRLRGLACWKGSNKANDNRKAQACRELDSTALLSEDDLVFQLGSTPVKDSSSSSSSPIAFPNDAMQDDDNAKQYYYSKEQDIFVSKAHNVPIWKRVWRGLIGKQRSPLALQEDSNSTTDSTEYYNNHDDNNNMGFVTASPHFSVSSNTAKAKRYVAPRVVTTIPTTSDAMAGEGIEMEWPKLSMPSDTDDDDRAKYLHVYLDPNSDSHSPRQSPRRSPQIRKRKPKIDFDQMSPSDSVSVGSAVLAVSFENQQDCAQLVFQSFGASSSEDEMTNLSTTTPLPLGTNFSHATASAPIAPLVDRQYARKPKQQSSGATDDWNAMEDPLLDNASLPSVEVSLTDFEPAGWPSSSYDDASFSSLLSSSRLFQPICRYASSNPVESLLFVPPSYFAGCFTHGPTLLDQAAADEEEEHFATLSTYNETRSEVSNLPPPSMVSL